MIDGKTKNNLLQELEKSGNVYFSCHKIGINRSTYYRWFQDDKVFRKNAVWAIRQGKANNCDIAVQALMIKIKEKDMRAIEFYLKHNDSTYKTKRNSNVIILHKKESLPAVGPIKIPIEKTIEEFINCRDREYEKFRKELADVEREISLRDDKEMIANQKTKIADENQPSSVIIDTADSTSEKDRPPKEPPENQMTSDK